MKPQAFLCADLPDLIEWIYASRIRSTCRANDHEGCVTGISRSHDLCLQRVQIKAEIFITGNNADIFCRESSQICGFQH